MEKETHTTKINEIFRLPIYYNEKKMEVQKHILEDLELVETIDPSANSMYSYAFQPQTEFGKEVLLQIPTYYTTDVEFLKENQKLLHFLNANKEDKTKDVYENQCKIVFDIWNEIKNDNGFKERYNYVDWSMWEHLNESDFFLQVMSIYNLTAPVMSLLMPFVILIIPFFVIRMKGLSINFTEYYRILSLVISNHSVGKLFTNFNSVKLDEKIYLVISAAFYVFSIYQNFLACFRFFKNLQKIHEYLKKIENYLRITEERMAFLIREIKGKELNTFTLFVVETEKKLCILREMREMLEKITPYKLSLQKITEFGYVLQCFYKMYNQPKYNEAILYSFGYHGYLELMKGLSQNSYLRHADLKEKMDKKKRKRGKKEVKNGIENGIVNMYYPTLLGKSTAVKNNFNFDKNYIVTGPNASGKTTILKSVLINIILTQQTGVGFYEKASFVPFKYVHCYLNIPDTSGRDSLFQAEARRCKNILDVIQENVTESHFCAFDELYSGTNPEEAVMSAYAFMKYLIKNKNVKCLSTTHFFQLCKHLQKEKKIVNVHMHTEKKDDSDDFIYHYRMKKGISTVRGGIKVLKDMKYPNEILENSIKWNLEDE